MNQNLEKDLVNCLDLINAKWQMQNDQLDKETKFIYSCNSLQECLNQINLRKANKDYALHRWYNYMTSVYCEQIFCDYGAIHDEDIYNHDVDIYINGKPYDVKLTVYPKKLNNHPYNLKSRAGKNEMIKWYYANQSQEARKQMLNRIYVVCDGASQIECLRLKSDFKILRTKIKAFMDNAIANDVNEIQITDNGITYSLKSDIVYISYE